jgi:hypothetical protein
LAAATCAGVGEDPLPVVWELVWLELVLEVDEVLFPVVDELSVVVLLFDGVAVVVVEVDVLGVVVVVLVAGEIVVDVPVGVVLVAELGVVLLVVLLLLPQPPMKTARTSRAANGALSARIIGAPIRTGCPPSRGRSPSPIRDGRRCRRAR